MDEDRTFQNQLQWLLDLEAGEIDRVRMQTFAKKFRYTQEESAEEAYLKVIQSPRISLARRQTLQQEYNAFKVNNSKQYWESIQMKHGLKSVARRAAVVTAEAGLHEAQEQYSTYPAASSKTTTGMRQPEFPESHGELNSANDMMPNENEVLAARSTSTPSDVSSDSVSSSASEPVPRSVPRKMVFCHRRTLAQPHRFVDEDCNYNSWVNGC